MIANFDGSGYVYDVDSYSWVDNDVRLLLVLDWLIKPGRNDRSDSDLDGSTGYAVLRY
jgi:hypothetical protein